ncbi:MAG: hypothetical protein HQL53_09045, partial [Magnetococcales bacterium]|nr:hypothetical protein [Magnetococcales bacterium]
MRAALKKLFILTLLTVAATLAAALLYAPDIATWGAKRGLDHLGIPVSALTVRTLTPYRLEIGPLAFRNEPLQATRLELRYTPEMLRQGRIDTLQIDGLRTTLRQQNGRWHLPLERHLPAERNAPSKSPTKAVPIPIPPLSTLILKEAQITAVRENEHHAVTGYAKITFQANQIRTQLDLHQQSHHLTLKADLTLHTEQGTQIKLDGELSAPQIAGWPVQTVQLSGELNGTPTKFQSHFTTQLTMDGTTPDKEIQIRQGVLDLQARLIFDQGEAQLFLQKPLNIHFKQLLIPKHRLHPKGRQSPGRQGGASCRSPSFGPS